MMRMVTIIIIIIISLSQLIFKKYHSYPIVGA